MIKIICEVIIVAVVLASCGGGGGGGNAGTGGSTSTTGSNTSMADGTPAVTLGDALTYAQVFTQSGLLPVNYWSTEMISGVNSDNSFNEYNVYSNFGALNQVVESGDYQKLSSNEQSNVNCSYFPLPNDIPRKLSVGTSWSLAYTKKCTPANGQSWTVPYTNVGSVVGVEQVTTPAGSFPAYKLTYTVTSVSPVSGTLKQTSTCWRDQIMNRIVACTDAYSDSYTTWTNTKQLVGYSVAVSPAKVATPATYAGSWAVTLSGSYSGNCLTFSISDAGSISAACIFYDKQGVGGTANVAGVVSANGSMTANGKMPVSTGILATITGSFNSAMHGEGTWTAGQYSGTWQGTHL